MQMSKNTFPRVAERGSGLSYDTHAKQQNGVSCFYIAIIFFGRSILCGSPGIGNPKRSVGLTGLEPVTLRLSSACSNQLSYRPKVRFLRRPKASWPLKIPGASNEQIRSSWRSGLLKGPLRSWTESQNLEVRGFEPLTYSLQSYRSTN